MEGPGGNPSGRRAGDPNQTGGASDLRDWQRNTWFGPVPQNSNPFEEPDNAPELLELRSENVRQKIGDFWEGEPDGPSVTGAVRRAAPKRTAGRKKSRVSGGTRAALVLIAAALVAMAMLYIIVFRVREIRVEGNAAISDADIIRFSGIRYGESVLTLDEDETERRIRTAAMAAASSSGNPNYYRLQFRYMDKEMPGTVIITVREREACCWMTWCGIMYVMDKNRMVLYETEDPGVQPDNLVEVKGLDIRSGNHAGQTLVLTSSVQETLFENMFLEMKVLGCTALIREVDMSSPASILLVTRDGYTVSFGDRSRIHAKMRSMLLVREELIRMGEAGGTINVSVPETPYYSPPSI